MNANSPYEVLLWDCDKSRPQTFDLTILWGEHASKSDGNAVSVLDVIEKNDEYLRERYLDLIYGIGALDVKGKSVAERLELKNRLSFWWLSLLAEKNYAKSPQIFEVLKLLALDLILSKHTNAQVTLCSSDRLTSRRIKGWASAKRIALNEIHSPHFSFGFQIKRLKRLPILRQLVAFLYISHYVVKRIPLRYLSYRLDDKARFDYIFVDYLDNFHRDDFDDQIFNSDYWHNISEVLGSKKNILWLHRYIEGQFASEVAAAKKLDLLNSRNKINQHHITLESFISLSLLAKALSVFCQVAFRAKTLEKHILTSTAHRCFWPFLKEDWDKSFFGLEGIINVLELLLFEKALGTLSNDATCFFLQENQCWEFGLLSVWKRSRKGKIIGVPHSTVRFWDLRYHHDERIFSETNTSSLPLPDYIACNGKHGFEQFKKSGYPLVRLVPVEALRYNYLVDAKFEKRTMEMGKITILVFGDYIQSNVERQIKTINNLPSALRDRISIIFKAHPNTPIQREEFVGVRIDLVNRIDPEIFRKVDAVVCGSTTSACIDALYARKSIFVLTDPSMLNLSPLKGFKYASFGAGSSELSDFLKNCLQPDSLIESNLDLLYLDQNLEKWRSFLGGICEQIGR